MSIDLTLPMPAELLIPHRAPMRLVENLLSYGAAAGVVEALPGSDCVLVDDRGALDEVALVELMAQGYAVIKGYDDLVQGRAISKGFLVGMKKLRITGRAAAGQRLLVHVTTVGTFEGFAVAEARIEHEGETVASGTIKLWIFDDASGGAA